MLYWKYVCGCFSVLNDIALLASTKRSMHLMLGICDDFGQFLMLESLNVSRCNNIPIVRSHRLASLSFLLASLELIIYIVCPHLSHIITSRNDDSLNVLNRRNSLWSDK